MLPFSQEQSGLQSWQATANLPSSRVDSTDVCVLHQECCSPHTPYRSTACALQRRLNGAWVQSCCANPRSWLVWWLELLLAAQSPSQSSSALAPARRGPTSTSLRCAQCLAASAAAGHCPIAKAWLACAQLVQLRAAIPQQGCRHPGDVLTSTQTVGHAELSGRAQRLPRILEWLTTTETLIKEATLLQITARGPA